MSDGGAKTARESFYIYENSFKKYAPDGNGRGEGEVPPGATRPQGRWPRMLNKLGKPLNGS